MLIYKAMLFVASQVRARSTAIVLERVVKSRHTLQRWRQNCVRTRFVVTATSTSNFRVTTLNHIYLSIGDTAFGLFEYLVQPRVLLYKNNHSCLNSQNL
ncbi:hypothetical protein QTP88_000319 [Uroleucon formosanum]